ncbi:undecaprenyl-diphosphate phosphatase [Atopobium sp. oral taxon 199]|uniref:undecaprenyl-diphosphate phosphatase n=1 Tax=Atopobium sp. oral taxon 199 TaxID=712156 RepID=UPI00034E7CEB|nr:undecaprenyl-diphosphatase UppP [Atopobium sp. oral taxon 199 str. F0494]
MYRQNERGVVDVWNLIVSALYGVVEGITEWLPISSTGHILLLNKFVPLAVTTDFWDMFLVVIQLGAILAVCVMFFHKLNPFSLKKTKEERKSTWILWAKVVVCCIPAAAVGIPLDNFIEEHLGGPYVIASTLIVYGLIFIALETHREKIARTAPVVQPQGKHMRLPTDATPLRRSADELSRVTDIDKLDWKTAFGIGLFQVLAIVPGTSRSGATIIGGLVLGCSRAVAAEFTFFLAIPTMVGASGLRLVKFFLKGNSFTSSEAAILAVGCIVAFAVSLVMVRALMGYVRKHDFKPFGIYRIVLGIAVIVYFALFA